MLKYTSLSKSVVHDFIKQCLMNPTIFELLKWSTPYRMIPTETKDPNAPGTLNFQSLIT